MAEAKKQLGAISAELIRRVDAVRGDVSRIRWVERAIEFRLGFLPDPVPVGPAVTDTSGPLAPGIDEERLREVAREAWRAPAPEATVVEPADIRPDPVDGFDGGVPERLVSSQELPAPPYRCPATACDFRVASAKARCPAHGRTVVAAG